LSAGGTYLNLGGMSREDVGVAAVEGVFRPFEFEAGDVRPAQARSLNQPILRADVAGMPLEWIDYREAARLYSQGQVAYSMGTPLFRLRGGYNAITGRRSQLEISSIIATIGHTGNPGNTREDYIPPLNNQTLFRRDGYLCLYCAQRFPVAELSRDHIRPFCQGGRDTWTNVATACRRCNNAKASRTPEQAGMQLIAVPFTPPTRSTSSSRAGACSRTRCSTCWRISRAAVRCMRASASGSTDRNDVQREHPAIRPDRGTPL
jgi:5-methylcytosine-specific restriction endonuclease McrA